MTRGYIDPTPGRVSRGLVLDYRSVSFPLRAGRAVGGAYPLEGVPARMRRYELMLVLSPEVPDDKSQAVIDKSTRQIVAAGGQIIKVAPWGRRRLAYPIGHHREGSYHIVLFESPPEALVELEHSLLITEEVIRHLVTRVERPSRASRNGDDEDADVDGLEDSLLPSDDDLDDEDDVPELIDESESEAAPAAID